MSQRRFKRPNPTANPGWKERAEELEQDLQEAESLNEDLQSRLDDIAEIAAPERAQADARIDRIEQMLIQLLQDRGLEPPAEVVEMEPGGPPE